MEFYDYRGFGLDVTSPATILHRAQVVNATIEGINSDVATSPPANSQVAQDWASFYASWQQFYASLQGVSGWLDRLWGGAMTQIDQYEKQASAWRSTLLAAGVAVITPDLPLPPTSELPVKTIIWGAVALGALYVGAKVLDFLPKGKR